MKTPIWIGVFLPKNISTEKHLTLENHMVLFLSYNILWIFFKNIFLERFFSFWNYYNTLFFFCNRLILLIKHAFKTFYCKHIVCNFTFCRLLLYNFFRTIWLLGVFFPQSIKRNLLEVRWCPMKGIFYGLFNNLDCTVNSTFKNLFQKGLKTIENTYSLNRCFQLQTTLDWETSNALKIRWFFFCPIIYYEFSSTIYS